MLKISHVCSESEKSQRPFHGDPVRICQRSPAPDSSAEWVRLRGSLLCAFGEETAELDPVTFFLEKEEARGTGSASGFFWKRGDSFPEEISGGLGIEGGRGYGFPF